MLNTLRITQQLIKSVRHVRDNVFSVEVSIDATRMHAHSSHNVERFPSLNQLPYSIVSK